jgi:hypothetical protein
MRGASRSWRDGGRLLEPGALGARFVACLVVVMLGFSGLSGCSGLVLWKMRRTTAAHHMPAHVVVYVAISPQVASVDDGGNVAALVDGLERELVARGKQVTVVAAQLDERPPVPRVELQFQIVDKGDMELRGAGQLTSLLGAPVGFGAITPTDSSDVLVDIYAVPESGPVTFTGRLRATNWGSTTGHDSVAAAENAGESIANTLLR